MKPFATASKRDTAPPTLGPDEARTVVLSMQKGGTLKSTSAAMIGHTLARLGCRVLLIDLAPTATLTTTLLGINDPTLATTAHVVAETCDAADAIVGVPAAWEPHPGEWADGGAPIGGGEFWVMPGNRNLQPKADQSANPSPHLLLRNAMRGLTSEAFDICLIDTDPTTGLLPQMALLASGMALVPFTPEQAAVAPLSDELTFLDRMAKGWNHPIRLAGVFPTKYQPRYTRLHLPMIEQAADLMATRETGMATSMWEQPQPDGSTVTGGGLWLPGVRASNDPVRASMRGVPPTDPDVVGAYIDLSLRVLALANPQAHHTITLGHQQLVDEIRGSHD